MPLPELTPEQLSGIEQHEKERKDRCERVLKNYKERNQDKFKSELSEEALKEIDNQEKIRQWLNADLTKKK